MNFLKYLKEIKLYLALLLVILIIINLNIYLDLSFSDILDSLIYLNILIIIAISIFLMAGYFSEKKKYNEFFLYISNQNNKKENLPNESFYKIIDKKIYDYEESIDSLKNELEEINDYMTNWIHQIKIPIAVLEIISKRIAEIENNESFSKDINIEIKRIENLVEQALYTSRAGNYSADFLIEEVNLEKVVKEVIKKNKHLFIYNKIDLEMRNLGYTVLTDKKWITHIVEQIIDNSCKYTDEYGKIEIYITKDEKSIKLNIKDNGMGISSQDIKRIFDKGFTGENGRKRTKSTGMGLYISKKVLNRLSHDIDVISSSGEYCNIIITFYNLSDYFNVT